MIISKRLETIAKLIDKDSKVIDVGCDHALLDIYLAKNNISDYIIASDNKKGPLEHAKNNIEKYQVEDKIKLKLGNGIETIEDEIDTIIISGMGGLNIVGVLKYHPKLYKKVKTLILSSNSDTEELRYEVNKMGFYIVEEKLVKEKNIIYPVIKFNKGKKHYSKVELLFGPILLQEKNSLFLEYLQRKKITKEKLISLLPRKYYRKRCELKKELKLIDKILGNR